MILWNIEHKSSIGENRLILVARKVTLKRWRWIKLAESEFWVLTGNATLFNFAKTRRKGVDFCLFASGSRDRAACVAQLRTKKPWHDKTKSPIRVGVNISLIPNKSTDKENQEYEWFCAEEVERNEISVVWCVLPGYFFALLLPGYFVCTGPSWVLLRCSSSFFCDSTQSSLCLHQRVSCSSNRSQRGQ